MDSNCVFCKTISGDLDSHMLYRDKKCVAFLDIQPVNPGHALVVPLEHHAYIYEVPDEIVKHMFWVGKKVSEMLRNAPIKCEGINFFLADGDAAFQEVFHSYRVFKDS